MMGTVSGAMHRSEDLDIPPDPHLDDFFRQSDPEHWDLLEQQIADAVEKKSVQLRLSTGMLASIPSSIGLAKDLTSLNLSGSELVTLPPTIGNLSKLTHLATYTCGLRFYPFELRQCKGLNYVHGDTLYIDLSSLYGRRFFPQFGLENHMPPCELSPGIDALRRERHLNEAAKAILSAWFPSDVAAIVAAYVPSAQFSCSWCKARVPYSSLSVDSVPSHVMWVQQQFGGDSRAYLPLLVRCCSSACTDAVRLEMKRIRPKADVPRRAMVDTMNAPLGGSHIGAWFDITDEKDARTRALLHFVGALSFRQESSVHPP